MNVRHRTTRPQRAALVLAVGAAVVAAPAPALAVPPPPVGPSPATVAGPSLRSALTDERIYSLMTDRFANGDPSNDTGGVPGGPLDNGYDPTSRAYYNGGDLKGVTSKLDYIQSLGMTSIWITPPMYNDWIFGEAPNQTASYHGYWITKFDQVDPHVGSEQDLRDLVNAAHAKGMKVFFDIVANHTGDVITYEEGESQPYIPKSEVPYKDAEGEPFDDRDYAQQPDFPALDPQISFPYTPTFRQPGDEVAKSPAWLNDVTMYHNRGETTFEGENSLYGDFFGLDDLFTERPEVSEGFVQIYRKWIDDYGIDGYRIDTTRHVNGEFWQAFNDGILDYARANGKPEFFMFGEAAVEDEVELSMYTTRDKYQSVLDFSFQGQARKFASQSTAPASSLRELFANDDWFTDHDSNAYQLTTFVDNHDRGRIGWMIRADNPGSSDWEQLRRMELAHELLFLARGNPVVYYGDEQGFASEGDADGMDQFARQSMFASQVPQYLDDDLIGTISTMAQDNWDTRHPMFRYIQRLSNVTEAHPALRNGTQVERYASDEAGVYAFSRIGATEQIEYVVALNNSTEDKTVAIPTYSAGMPFTRVYPAGNTTLQTAADSTLTVTVPRLSAQVFRAAVPVAASEAAPTARIINLPVGPGVSGRQQIEATVTGNGYATVSFAVRVAGTQDWTLIGSDDNPNYSVYYDVTAHPLGTRLQFAAVVTDNAGHTRTSPIVTRVVRNPA